MYTDCFPITLNMINDTRPLVLRLQVFNDAETLFWYAETNNGYVPRFTYKLNGRAAAASTGWSERFVRQCAFPKCGDIDGPFPLMSKQKYNELLMLTEFNGGRKSQNLWKVFGYFFINCYFYCGFKLSEDEISAALKLSRTTVSSCINTLIYLDLLRIKTDYISTKQSRSYLINIDVYAEPTRKQSRIAFHTYNTKEMAEKNKIDAIKLLINENLTDDEIAAQLNCGAATVLSVRAYNTRVQMRSEDGVPQIIFTNVNDAAAWLVKYQLSSLTNINTVKLNIINALKNDVAAYYHKFSFTTAPISIISEQENKKFIANNYELMPVQNINTNEIFPTAKDAAASLGKSTSRFIIACCRGINKTAYGYKWKFIDSFE